MSMLQNTLRLYAAVAGDTARALPRSALAILALLLAHAALMVAAAVFAPLGFAGSLALGFVHAGAVGWYLALVEVGVIGRRRVRIGDLSDNLGTYLWDVISVLFVFMIASLLLRGLPPSVNLVVVLVATLLFNAVPEMIYQERNVQGLGLLGDAIRFMQHNWPEWLGAHALAALALVGWGLVIGGGALSLGFAVSLLQIFGPWFGFIDAGGLAIAMAGAHPLGILWGALLLVFVHAFLLFRGLLYQRLAGSSRRARAWQARAR